MSQHSKPIEFGISIDRGRPSQEQALLALAARYHIPVGTDVLRALVSDTFQLAESGTLPDDPYNQKKGWLFQLARRLARHFPASERPGLAEKISPVALVFVEVVSQHVEFPSDGIDWTDEVDVRTAFEVEWNRVNFAEGEDLLREAVASAKQKPCIAGNSRLGTIVSTGYHLQVRNGGKNFYLPTNDDVADLLGISKVQLSTYIKSAIDRGFFRVLKAHIPNVKAKLLQFDTSHPDLLPPFRG